MYTIITNLLSQSLAPLIPRAQSTPTVCEDCPVIGDGSSFDNFNADSAAELIIGVAQFASYIAIAVAVLLLVISGLQMVVDTGDGKRAEAGRKNFTTTLIGLVLVILAFTIVQVLSNVLTGDVLGTFI